MVPLAARPPPPVLATLKMSSFAITTAINGSALTRLGSVAALAWTRSTTTATVTQASHGMVTGDLFNVTVTSDAAAITTGVKTITFLTSSTFSFTCLNAGAASGTVTANHIDDFLLNGGRWTDRLPDDPLIRAPAVNRVMRVLNYALELAESGRSLASVKLVFSEPDAAPTPTPTPTEKRGKQPA